MLYIYEITTSEGEIYTSTQTEFMFDGENWLGSSNLYMQSSDTSWRPYVVAGTDQLYKPRVSSSITSYYVDIVDVNVKRVNSFDFLPSMIIMFLVVLVFISLRSLLRRR